MVKKLSFVLSLLFLLNLNSCVLVPFIDSYKNIGVTESDRQSLFAKQIKEFQNNIYWGNYNKALTFASEGSALIIKESLKDYKEKKVVEFKSDDVVFSDSSKIAKAHVVVKYYNLSQYVVKEQHVEETWEFSVGKWSIKERVILSEE